MKIHHRLSKNLINFYILACSVKAGFEIYWQNFIALALILGPTNQEAQSISRRIVDYFITPGNKRKSP